MGVSGELHTLNFYPDVYRIGSRMGFRTGLDTSEKIYVAPSGNRSTTVHPVASSRRIKVMTFVMEFYLFYELVEVFEHGRGDGITCRPQRSLLGNVTKSSVRKLLSHP